MAVSPFLASSQRIRRWRLLGGVVAVIVAMLAIIFGIRHTGATETIPLNAITPSPVPDELAAGQNKLMKQCLLPDALKRVGDAKIYNAVTTSGYGTDVLIYSKTWAIGCMVGAGGTTTSPEKTSDTGWLAGPVSIDLLAGENHHSELKAPGYDLVGGRASRSVAKVTIKVHGDTATVKTVNGTFLAHIPRPKNIPADTGTTPVTVTTFDSSGKRLAVFDNASLRNPTTHETKCVQTPDGKRIVTDGIHYSAGACIVATRWE